MAVVVAAGHFVSVGIESVGIRDRVHGKERERGGPVIRDTCDCRLYIYILLHY